MYPFRYAQYDPHPLLRPYIDAYWTVQGSTHEAVSQRIFPDGCVDIICNLGADYDMGPGELPMKNEKAYLVGTMTTYIDTSPNKNIHLLGIRFKPAGFSAFYRFTSLHEIADCTIECEKQLTPDLKKISTDFTVYLDGYFLERLPANGHWLFPVITDVQNQKGNIKVTTLAQKHGTTVRQLERNFRSQVGLSPKAFINLVRYQQAMKAIQQKGTHKTLEEIAFDCGYYDHAHLTNEIQKYTGLVPSLL